MTPEEQNELDQVKQTLRLTDAELKDARGKIKAMERNLYETKREAEKTLAEAKCLKTETEQSLDVAADQMRVAHSIGLGIFGMAELCRSRVARASAAARTVYRENHMVELIEGLVKADASGDSSTRQQKIESLKKIAAGVRHDVEANRQVAHEQYIAHGFENFEAVWQALLDSENSLPVGETVQ